MLRDLLPLLRCPYCGGAMHLKREVESDAERIHYGLLACRCFGIRSAAQALCSRHSVARLFRDQDLKHSP